MYLLHFHDEIRQEDEVNLPKEPIKHYQVKPNELEMAVTLINQMADTFKPEKYHNDYRDALQKWIVETWHRFINPNRTLSQEVTLLTGLTNENLYDSPSFESISEELIGLLQGSILVAHNARFDLSFLKNAFKRVGMTYQTQALCTIKLFKQLEPNHKSYRLNALASQKGIAPKTYHRAEADVDTLYQLLQGLFNEHGIDNVLYIAKTIYQKSSIPSKLKTDIQSIPDIFGVYLFYSEHSAIPVYIGKSVALRQRVLSHFQNDYLTAKEFTLSQQVERVEFITTAGELSALLLESKLIKEYMPIYNRRLRRKKK